MGPINVEAHTRMGLVKRQLMYKFSFVTCTQHILCRNSALTWFFRPLWKDSPNLSLSTRVSWYLKGVSKNWRLYNSKVSFFKNLLISNKNWDIFTFQNIAIADICHPQKILK